MHLARLLPLMLLVACTRSPDMSACRLVGTWEIIQAKPLTIGSVGTDANGKIVEEIRELPTEPYTALSETFRADGTWELRGCAPQSASLAAGTWRVLEDAADRVKVEIPFLKAHDGHPAREFVFESPDRMREAGSHPDAPPYTRVRSK